MTTNSSDAVAGQLVRVVRPRAWWRESALPECRPCVTTCEDEAQHWRDEEHRDSGDYPLASDGEVIALGDGGYGSGNCYGGDILQALAVIAGVRVESV